MGLWLHAGILRHVSYFSVCPVIVVACMMHFSLLCLVDLPVWHEPFVCLPWRFSCQNMSIYMDCIPVGVLFVRLFLTEFVGLHCSAAFACEFDVFSCGTCTDPLQRDIVSGRYVLFVDMITESHWPRMQHKQANDCSGVLLKLKVRSWL